MEDRIEAAKGATLDRGETARVARGERRRAKRAAKAAKRAERNREKRRDKAKRRGRRMPAESFPGALVLRSTRSSQDALGYEKLFEDGLVLVEEGVWSRVIEFDDINFQTARDDTQHQTFERWRAMWNQIDPGIKVQLKIVCHVVDRERFVSEMTLPMVEGDDIGNPFRRELNSIIERQVTATRQNVERRRLLVLTCHADDSAEATATIAHAIESVTRALMGMGVTGTHVLSGDELLDLIDSLTNPEDERGQACFDQLRSRDARGRTAVELGYTTRDLVAPPDVTRTDPRHISWGTCHGQALYVSSWGNTCRTNMLSALAELPVTQVITVDVRPWDPANAVDLVESINTDLKAQRTEYILDHSQTMYVTDEMLPTPLQDALASVRATRDDLVNGDELLFTIGISILTWAPDDEGCERSAKLISETMRRYGYRVSPLATLQGQGFAAAMPTGRYDIPYTRTITSSPLAALVPFSGVEILEKGGMYMGQNILSKNFIFCDRAHMTAPNGFILGQLGRGKSVAAKSMVLWTRLLSPDSDIVIIDPENEYRPLVEALGGHMVKVGAGSTTYFNPLDLAIEGTDPEDGPLELKTDMVISAVIMMAKNVSELQKSVVDRCVKLIYAKYLETHDPADQPVLSDLYVALREQPEAEAAELATTIERYILGQAALFNHRTNVEVGPDQHLVCFDIRDNGENLKPLVELFVLDYVWQRVVRNRALGRRTWIFIDEIHLLFDSEYSIRFFDSIWSRSRKYGAIPTGITQNAERLLENPHTRKMLSNSDFLVLLGQASTDAATIGQERQLSDEQVSFLERATPGSGLICAGGKVVEFTNVIPEDTQIFRLFNTRPGEGPATGA